MSKPLQTTINTKGWALAIAIRRAYPYQPPVDTIAGIWAHNGKFVYFEPPKIWIISRA